MAATELLHAPINLITLPSGRVRMVCEFCGRQTSSRANKYDTPAEWSTAPFYDDTVHADGSTGSLYECPACYKRMQSGEGLHPRREPLAR